MFHVRKIEPHLALRGDHVLIAGEQVLFPDTPTVVGTHPTPDGCTDVLLLRADEAAAEFLHLGPGDGLTVSRNL